ncbi:MAG: (2Fe-2S)-binding protein [Caldisericaceae bacterium]|nr:(2Fe-2S)-binding protein [Caldisericaceae bacterium]RLD20270.1 MAG: (2Fe-2S)-binding protein [Caldisericota bacterium]
MEKITLVLNGKKETIYFEEGDTLLYVLRDRIGLTGTKFGCGYGVCGACTVVVNGEAVRSCKVLFKTLEGTDILTIEGLTDGEKLHPIQQAFVDANAVQCGFCTPGIVMELYALFGKEPDASDDRIKEVLSGHLCRCTGYESIFDAAKLAQKTENYSKQDKKDFESAAKLAREYMKKSRKEEK